MCTAISCKFTSHYFGRNLDLEYSFKESVAITPRYYSFKFRREERIDRHYAMIGMAYVYEGYPLYYDAVNEKGLGIAALSFPGNAIYLREKEDAYNIAPFELIPWVLAKCQSVKEAKELLKQTNLIHLSFNCELPLTPLHFMISDKEESIVVEPLQEGLSIIENPVEVLTNNPPFSYQLYHLQEYLALTKKEPINTFAKELPLETFSRGMGGIGLPGDLSSPSRFVRAAFTRWNSLTGENEAESVSQFFHILASVEQQKGCVQVEDENYEYTIYSSCCDTEKGIYYYKTYHSGQIWAVDMHHEELDEAEVVSYLLTRIPSVKWHN